MRVNDNSISIDDSAMKQMQMKEGLKIEEQENESDSEEESDDEEGEEEMIDHDEIYVIDPSTESKHQEAL